MQLAYCWIKDQAGALDHAFVTPIAQACGIRAFVETGTYLGDTIASMEPHFDTLASIELSPALAAGARSRFEGQAKVEIFEGDSSSGLIEALEGLGDEPAFVWLDAHYSGGVTVKGTGNTPVMAELSYLVEGRRGRDVILIDDVRNFWPVPEAGFKKHEAIGGYPALDAIANYLRSTVGYRVMIMGDALLAVPGGLARTLRPSEVLVACTASRLAPMGAPFEPRVGTAVASARDGEREALATIPDAMLHQSEYGLGGHYFLWRGLVRADDGDAAGAAADLAFAARCGVAVPIVAYEEGLR